MNIFIFVVWIVTFLKLMVATGNVTVVSASFRSSVLGSNPLTRNHDFSAVLEFQFLGRDQSKATYDTSTTPAYLLSYPSLFVHVPYQKCSNSSAPVAANTLTILAYGTVVSLVGGCLLSSGILLNVLLNDVSSNAYHQIGFHLQWLFTLFTFIAFAFGLATSVCMLLTRKCLERELSSRLNEAVADTGYTFTASMSSWPALTFLLMSSVSLSLLCVLLQWIGLGSYGPNFRGATSPNDAQDETQFSLDELQLQ